MENLAQNQKVGIIIFSENLVAADVMGANYLGKNPLRIPHLKLAQETGFGTTDLNRMEVFEISAE